MSHTVRIDFEILNLNDLKETCASLGFEFLEGQETFRSYQTGRCDHAIRVPGASYEIGVKAENDGNYSLAWDPYHVGGLVDKVGQDASVLKQAYRKTQLQHEARRMKKRIILEEYDGKVLHLRLG
jgi:hypothetical protein